MKLLYYGTTNNGDGKRLQQVIESVVSIEKTEVYRNIAELDKRLRHPASDITISVLFTKKQGGALRPYFNKKIAY